MSTQQADLYFGQTHQPVGFTSGLLTQFDGSPEPVVRELLQNCLDATGLADRQPGEVQFVICRAPRAQLPGLDTYTGALALALEDRKRRNQGSPSHDERMVVKRIQESLQATEIPILLCIDNGHGLNGRRMDALLTPGNTDKGEAGAGSFGLGHHAAFGASDLRYVLYAARYRDTDGAIKTISSGHTILATHLDGQNCIRAADGYWFRSGHGQTAFDGSSTVYPDGVPELLEPHLASLEDTGTVVCIAGFNEFRREEDDPTYVESICRVAAANFSAAIHQRELVVTVRDEIEGIEESITRTSLGQILERYSENRRAEKQGQINGERAFDAWLTISRGERIPWVRGGVICWRRLDEPRRVMQRVHVFRQGMWITSTAPGLGAAEFSDMWPFDGVLLLDDGPLETLVRSAEGPEHRELDKRRLSTEEKKEFRELIADVVARLRAAVGKRDDLQQFTPPGFAMISGHTIREAEPIRRPRLPAGGGSEGERVASGKGETGSQQRRQRRAGTPRGGSVPRYRTTLRPGQRASVIEARIEYEEEVGPQSEIGVRIRAASGADGTCEQPLPDTFLRMTRVSDETGAYAGAGTPEGALELILPARAGSRSLTVTLVSPVPDLQVLELDLVKRRPPSSDQQETGDA